MLGKIVVLDIYFLVDDGISWKIPIQCMQRMELGREADLRVKELGFPSGLALVKTMDLNYDPRENV